MKPASNTITQVDDLPGEEIAFGIGDPRWVMRTQAELYSDVSTAVIREYSTNAYDAHVMAGHRDPIEVTLPSALSPEFVVKDHGVGMSLDDWRQIYTQFGTSNKRGSNDTNGMLGYGSNSGVAYTTSFQVTSVKDGIKNVGVVQRKPDWSIVLKVVATSATTEPNGTEIRIPVHNIQEFNHKAGEFYKFWLPGRVLVNGKAPQHAVGKQIIDNLYYSEQWNTSYVVMGNVGYRIANPDVLFTSTQMNRINFVAYVDEFKTEDGGAAVEFVPSREDLKYTERTKATLQKVVNNFEANIVRVAQAEIDAATSHFDAYVLWRNWTSMLGKNLFKALTFKGDEFESQFKINASRWAVGGYRNSVYHVSQWDVESMDRTLVVTEFNQQTSSSIKTKTREYIALNVPGGVSYVLFTPQRAKDITSPWISKDKFVTWETLKASLPKKVRTPGVASNFGRIKGSFDYITRKGTEYEKTVPATKHQLYYISVQDEKRISVKELLNYLNMDNTVIILGANRIAKFKRDYPKVKDFYAYVRGLVVTDGSSLLSQDARDGLDVSSELSTWLDKLNVDKIDDPEFKRVAGLRKNLKALTKKYDDNMTLANKVGMVYNVRRYEPKSKSFGLLKKYSLMNEFSYWNVTDAIAREITIYINAKYAASV